MDDLMSHVEGCPCGDYNADCYCFCHELQQLPVEEPGVYRLGEADDHTDLGERGPNV